MADLTAAAIVVSGGTAAPLLVAVAAGAGAGFTGNLTDQLLDDQPGVDGTELAIATGTGGALGYLGGKIAPSIAKIFKGKNLQGVVGAAELEVTQIGPIKIGGGALQAEGYANAGKLAKHLEKRLAQGYRFKDTNEMVKYGEDFFKRVGSNIEEFTSAEGFVHRIDKATQEYGVLQSDGKIQSVFKVEPNEKTLFQDAKSYLEIQLKTYPPKEE